MLDYENSRNPFRERRLQIADWRAYSEVNIDEDEEVIDTATRLSQHGIKKMDSLHIACAITAAVDYFLTTDDEILKRAMHIQAIRITDPIGFIKEVLS